MSDLSKIPVLVPEGIDDIADIPMGALDSACNHLKCDVVEAVQGKVPGKKYAALVEFCYQWARIAGVDKPDRETYRAYRADEIAHALGMDRIAEELEEAAADPTQPLDEQTDASIGSSSGSPSHSGSGVSLLTSTG